jgi:hypothetical protein
VTAYENPLLLLLSFVILAVAFSVVLKHFKVISVLVPVVAAGGLVIFRGVVRIRDCDRNRYGTSDDGEMPDSARAAGKSVHGTG